jgi:hypothetical protein
MLLLIMAVVSMLLQKVQYFFLVKARRENCKFYNP